MRAVALAIALLAVLAALVWWLGREADRSSTAEATREASANEWERRERSEIPDRPPNPPDYGGSMW